MVHSRFHNIGVAAGAALLLVAVLGPGARAASPAQWKDCENAYPPDKQIVACTRIIQSRTESPAERIKALKQRAWAHYFKEAYRPMFADLDETVRLAPEDPDIYRNRAHFHRETGDLDAAIADHGQAIRIKPLAWYYSERANLYRQKGDENRAIADYTEALRIYDEEHSKDPEKFHYYGRSMIYRELGRVDDALRDFSEFLKRQKDWNEHYVITHGDLLMNKGDVERAILEYSEVIRRKPDDDTTYYRRALAYRANGDNTLAVADYNKLLSGYGRDNPDALNGRGLAYAASGRLDAAVRDFSRAIELYNEDPEVFYNRAQAYRLLGRNDPALRDYGIAIGLNPTNAVFFNSRARAYLAAGDTDQALADLDEAIRLDDKFAVAYFNRGMIRQAAKQYGEAISDYDRAIARDAAQPEYLAARGFAFLATGAPERAIADFTSALQLEPVNASFYAVRASARLKNGQIDAALDDVNRALLLDRNLSAAYAVRAAIHAAMGNRELASSDRRSADETRSRSGDAKQKQVAAATEAPAAAPSAARLVIDGSFPIDGGGGVRHGLSDLAVEIKGSVVTYRRSTFLEISTRAGKNGTATFPVTCNNRPTDTQGDRVLSATVSGRRIHLDYVSRFEFRNGPCRGMYNHREEKISITAADEGCRFSYSETTDVKNAGAPVRASITIKDQPCVTERFDP